ncbi:MAG: ATP-binding cassette domain-containing protein, partial [Bacteroidota bacterium]|nr:ATP-binding cassette domain-containing protein [Bacteroidota bacterium]
MSESVLNALMQLFALVSGIGDDENSKTYSKQVVRLYLQTHLSTELIEKYLKVYDQFLKQFTQPLGSNKKKKISASSVKILKIAEKINSTLNRIEKVLVLVRVIEYAKQNEQIDMQELDLIATLADTFTVNTDEYQNILNFILGTYQKMPDRNKLISVNSKKEKPNYIVNEKSHLFDSNFEGELNILYVESIEKFFFIFNNDLKLRLTGRNLIPNRIYLFDNGSIIRGKKINPIYQTKISNIFLFSHDIQKIKLVAQKVEFKYKNSENGIQKVSFELESGELVGIMGGSGVGKSTFLNILIGKYPLTSGKITINGHDLHSNKKGLNDLMGYVPQDDLLIEELTVYQNLYFNAKLCFGSYSKEKINLAVEKTLKELDLFEIKDLKVGSSLNKFISGGQRKRLNIALELIREPAILFVDEPTSGLSSTDSEIVMDLLKHQSLRGKLVIVNIHQPSSDIYKLFNSIWVFDRGGYPVYQGNPLDALIYFKEAESYVDYQDVECPACGDVHPEELLEILEEKMVNEFGKYKDERKTKPKEWYTLFRVNLEKRSRIKKQEKIDLPKSPFNIPSKLKQFFVFFQRDILSKLADKQYLFINLLEAPLLGMILAFFSKKIGDDGIYVFAQNINFPIFLFMSVVVAMFLGMSVSAEEIIKDRKILEREKFLNLSRFSYLSSKITVLLLLSAYQIFTYLLVTVLILEIKGMFWGYWLILFSTAVASNILGLNISSSFKNVVTIYIIIPLILVPEMLLGGAMIKFDDIYPTITNKKYVPLIGDIMISRWAYEALTVGQYKNNEFEKHFFEIEKEKSEAMYYSAYLIPELKIMLQKCKKGLTEPKYESTTKNYLATVKNEMQKLLNIPELQDLTYPQMSNLTYESFNEQIADQTIIFLEKIRVAFNERTNRLNKIKDEKYVELIKK